MLKKVLKYGLGAGAILTILLWIMLTLCVREIVGFGNGAVVGYAGMLIAFSLIYFCIKSYRDNVNDGVIKVWQALLIGVSVVVVAAIIHSFGWALYNFVFPDFKELYIQKFTEYLATGIGKEASQSDIDGVKSQVAMMRMIYDNPLLDLVFTAFMMMPVGLLVTIISAILLRKKNTGNTQTEQI